VEIVSFPDLKYVEVKGSVFETSVPMWQTRHSHNPEDHSMTLYHD